jgi:MFS family permease
MFNALNGLGGGGQVSGHASSDSNTALYSTFAVVGFFAGSVINRFGVKWSLAFGGIGYCVYVSAWLVYNFVPVMGPNGEIITPGTVSEQAGIGYITFAGAFLGICAGILWTAQGTIMMAYPLEKDKGKFVSTFWIIFNLGGVIGSLVPLGQNINTVTKASVSNGTYVGFLILTLIGGILAWTMIDASKVVRSDGSRVILMKHPSVASEFLGLYQTLRRDLWIIGLFPMFFASNWFYTYHFNGVNAAYFTTRTRALNGVLYWSAQIVGAGIIGPLLDYKRVRRSLRAKLMWATLFVLTMVVWGGGYVFQEGYTRESTAPGVYSGMDWTTPGYVGPMFLYIFYGLYDAVWQTCTYWYVSFTTYLFTSSQITRFTDMHAG